jgi:hypothetical protein
MSNPQTQEPQFMSMQLSQLPKEQRDVLNSININISMSSSRISELEKEIKRKQRKLDESPEALEIKRDKLKLAATKRRYFELQQQFMGIFNVATGYDPNKSIASKLEAIFKEMDEEDYLIAQFDAQKALPAAAKKGRKR